MSAENTILIFSLIIFFCIVAIIIAGIGVLVYRKFFNVERSKVIKFVKIEGIEDEGIVSKAKKEEGERLPPLIKSLPNQFIFYK